MLLGKAERPAALRDSGVARVAHVAQRVDRRRVGRAVGAQGREHVRAHRAAQVRAIAAPVVRHWRRLIQRLTLQIEGLVVSG